jgi:preprotein translocase subunit SecD
LKKSFATAVTLFVLVLSTLVLIHNFVERELELFINPTVKNLDETKRAELLSRFKKKWDEEYNKNSSLSISPEISSKLPDVFFLVKSRFITSAKINQISQENIELFVESKNSLRPTPVENFVRNGKSLAIKLGLDLQGGMRVVMKGDFETYSAKLRDIYSKDISDNKKILDDPTKPKEEKTKAKNRLEDIEFSLKLTEQRKLVELEKAKLIIDNRLTNQNLTEPQVRIQKDQDSIEVALPGVANSTQILEILQNTETVEYRLEEPSSVSNYANQIFADERKLLEEGKREETDIVQFQNLIKDRLGKKAKEDFLSKLEEKYKIPTDRYKIFAYYERGKGQNSSFVPRRFMVLEKSIALSGNDLTNAKGNYDSNKFSWTVSMELTPAGTDKFYEVTKNNKGRNLAIIWGDKVISSPQINEPIAGGRAEISGSFTQEDSIQLSNIISEGALPIPLTVLEMRFIGPTLGIESIQVGLKSVIIGFILVMIYMILYYKLAGIVADIALICNLIILLGLLSLMDFTLTLPGFAGIILTVGMAVDANVIIYERIKEELMKGKALPNAVAQGFDNAFWTIFDSNITTLISGILMIKLGNGPIKGFAITLCWGIITSMFTSLLLSRLILNLLVDKVGIRNLRLGFKNYEVKNV